MGKLEHKQDQQELAVLLRMVAYRNTAAHVYDEFMAQELCEKIVNDFEVIAGVIEKVT